MGHPPFTNCSLMAFENVSISLVGPVKTPPGDSSTYVPYDSYGL